jgi:hypothetical protein
MPSSHLSAQLRHQSNSDSAPNRRVFARLPLPVRPGDDVTLSDGTRGVVETASVADDLRDAKCVVVLDA